VVSLSAIQAHAMLSGFFITTHAFMYQNCRMSDLGTLGGSQSSAQPISRQGTIVGFSSRGDGTQRAFSYFQGVMSDLGGDPSLMESAFAISGWQLSVGIESATGGLGAQGVWYFNGRTFRLPSYLLNPPSGTANVQHVTGLKRGSCLGFSLETAKGLHVVGEFVRKEFQGDVATKLEVFCLIHHAHATAANLAEDAVLRNRLPPGLGRRGH
jgi:probable HAF family extracellular repeat protein